MQTSNENGGSKISLTTRPILENNNSQQQNPGMPPSCCSFLSDRLEMSGCGCVQFGRHKSPEEAEMKARSRQIEKELQQDKRRMQRQVKLLLLGAGESGKSTFLKQMKIIHGVVFEADQIKEYRQIIFQNMIRGMRVLVDASRKLQIAIENPVPNNHYGDRLLELTSKSPALQGTVDPKDFSQHFKSPLLSLWSDPGIRKTFSRRSEFQIADSLEYFYENIDRIAVADYQPTQQDILYSRKTTKGIIEFPLTIEDIPFLFVDVGGQRTQRQKWIQCFDSVTAILFMASASEYDQVLLEDRTVNRLAESRNIFDAIVNHRSFEKISFILFLNKMDLLEEKVLHRKVDIEQYFEEEFNDADEVKKIVERFGGDPLNLDDVKSFILYLFVSRQKTNVKPLYHHFTTAVDTRNIQYVFNSVKETILRKNLDALMLQ